jgi:hypothetical protein
MEWLMSGTVQTVLALVRDHPLIALALILFVLIPLVLGWMHEGRILADCSVPLIRHFKRECREWRETGRRLRHEFESWNVEE